MKIKYSKEADVLIIQLRNGKLADSVDLKEGVILHLDNEGLPLELEILDAAKLSMLNEITLTAPMWMFESWQGNTLDLTNPSKIQVNEETMRGEKEWLTGFVYRVSNIRNKDNLYIFEFTDTENKIYTNRLKLHPVEIDSLPPQLSKTSEYEIFWRGVPVGHNESVNLTIAVSDTISATLSTNIQGANSIIIRPNDISSLFPGHANLYINREIGTSLEQPTKVEGEIGGIYRGKVKHVRIVE
ncbi:MAG: DUF2283 domain-containing protein [Bacteroidia bacterium]|nr:DUF2283 domain-containing protein [Bacteroidia bacterium]